jgi:hypothetical protein
VFLVLESPQLEFHDDEPSRRATIRRHRVLLLEINERTTAEPHVGRRGLVQTSTRAVIGSSASFSTIEMVDTEDR